MSHAEPLLEVQPEPRSVHRSASASPRAPQRIAIITRPERRRRWSAQQKRKIVAESLSPSSSALATARKHGISSGQLYIWRGQARRGELGDRPAPPPRFVRIDAPALAEPLAPGLIEIALPSGARVRIDAHVDAAALRLVLEALAP